VDSAPHIKLCGTTSLADARLAVDVGAWAVGLIFHEPSPRRCSLAEADRIAAALRRQVLVAGVFVNEQLDHVTEVADRLALDLIQLHGDEGPAYCHEVARRTGAKIIKARQVHSGADLQALEAYAVDFHLLDTWSPDVRGGSGATWDWSIARRHRGSVPVILSGGLTAENVGGAIAAMHPFAVDVASGTESQPGVKDPAAVQAFVSAVRATVPPAADPGEIAAEAPADVPERAA
jgi:phosphoribosylanthranilate isomerase